jgi:hypothetical protein
VTGSSLVIPPTKADGVDEDGEDDVDDEDDEDGPTRRARMCCWSKPTGEQRQATRGAGSIPGLLVGPRSMTRDPAHAPASGLLGVPPDLVPDQEGIMC